MDDVGAGEVLAQEAEQLVLGEQAGEWRGRGLRYSGQLQERLPHDGDGDGAWSGRGEMMVEEDVPVRCPEVGLCECRWRRGKVSEESARRLVSGSHRQALFNNRKDGFRATGLLSTHAHLSGADHIFACAAEAPSIVVIALSAKRTCMRECSKLRYARQVEVSLCAVDP